MKECRYCGNYSPETDFGIAKTTERKVYRRRKCRYCYRRTKTRLRRKQRDFLKQYKKDKACIKCGVDDYRVLDFHHIRDKKFAISEYYHHQFGLERLIKEIEKCIVICANCHRIEHSKARKRNSGV